MRNEEEIKRMIEELEATASIINKFGLKIPNINSKIAALKWVLEIEDE